MIVCRDEIAEKTPRSIGELNVWKKKLIAPTSEPVSKSEGNKSEAPRVAQETAEKQLKEKLWAAA
jgi:hypothetical protein